MLNARDNYLRTVRRKNPRWIPASIHVSDASLYESGKDLEAVISNHCELFPWYNPGNLQRQAIARPAYTAGSDFTDSWGCTWRTARDGIEGVVINAPLARWEDLAAYRIPDPDICWDRQAADWAGTEQNIRCEREAGKVVTGYLSHGFLFMRLQYLRGFANLMYDMADGEPKLASLIAGIDEHNRKIADKYLSLGVDIMEFPEDLGTQMASVISPELFRKWLKPSYQELAALCRKKGVLTALHSDGYIMELLDDLLDIGFDIINPQDLCNGIDNLARELKGRACIRLDIDRQKILPYGTRQDIFDLIEEEVRKLGSPQGGLELLAGIYPPVPPENVDALCAAITKYRTWWWD